MKKTKIKMNKPIYLGFSILEISKMLMYEFWYDFIKPMYDKLCYRDTYSFINDIETEGFYEDIVDDVEKRFDTSNYEVNIPFPIGKYKKKIRKKEPKKCVIKRNLKFWDYKNCLLNNEVILK